MISLSAPQQTSLPDAEIDSGVFEQISSLTGAQSRGQGKVITCAKMSRNSCPSYSAASFIKSTLKKCDSVWKKEKNCAATTCGGLGPRQTLPPVCTPRQMTIGLQAWLAQRSPIQYLFSQFKALAAAHLVSAVQSNAPLITTLRLRSPQSHILQLVPATNSTSAVPRNMARQHPGEGWGGSRAGLRVGGKGILLKPHFAVAWTAALCSLAWSHSPH